MRVYNDECKNYRYYTACAKTPPWFCKYQYTSRQKKFIQKFIIFTVNFLFSITFRYLVPEVPLIIFPRIYLFHTPDLEHLVVPANPTYVHHLPK